MPQRWWVASDRATRLAMPPPGRREHVVRDRRPQRVPERYGHAVPEGTERTLCGRTLLALHRFERLSFETLGHHLRCPVCDELAGHPHAPHRRG